MEDALAHAREHHDDHLEDLKRFLRIPSVSTDPEREEDLERGAGWVAAALDDAGLDDVQIHATDKHPIVTGRYTGAGADAPTVLVYGHYDVQPPDPLDEWETEPFDPTVRDGNIYARGATDNKGQLLTHVNAVGAYLEAEGELPVNVTFLIEGEEEVGSPSLAPFLEEHRDLVDADVLLVSDMAMWDEGTPALTTGMRGLAYVEVTVEGPRRDLHSGVYGGAVGNPANALARILGSLHDEDGRVTIPGFYEEVQPVPERTRQEWEDLDLDEAAMAEELGVTELAGEAGYSTLERRWARPTLDVNGIQGGFAGEGAKTIIPAEASAKVSMRLVADQDPDRIADRFRKTVEERAPSGVSVDVEEAHHGTPVVVDRDHPAVRAGERALEGTWGRSPVAVRSGGTIPVIATFVQELDVPAVLMGFGLRSENLHAPNEHFHLENLRRGTEASIRFWDEAADADLA
jgi:acetylornithine deacetylase/succinyl-diaminopimelate desuccinylase-like protein